jgi:hypothetical protein
LHAPPSSFISHVIDKLRERIWNPVGMSMRGIAEMVTKSAGASGQCPEGDLAISLKETLRFFGAL